MDAGAEDQKVPVKNNPFSQNIKNILQVASIPEASLLQWVQGTEDQVVPPNQATEMYVALSKKGLKTALVMFEGEQHGFRQATNIRRALDGEFYFYGKALGFNAEMPEGLEPIKVVN